MLAEPIFAAVEGLRAEAGGALPLVFLSPSGETFNHALACELAAGPDFIMLCGRYEGVDQRVIDHLVDREISLGDYVLSGGELAAMAVAVPRGCRPRRSASPESMTTQADDPSEN